MNYLAACRWDGVNFLFFVVGEFVLSLVVVSDFVDQLIEAIGEGVDVETVEQVDIERLPARLGRQQLRRHEASEGVRETPPNKTTPKIGAAEQS